ncbi:MAG: PhoX family phosphatase [Actinomycetota bacterium]
MMNDDIEDIPTNASGNRPFEDVLAAHVGRRTVLRGGALGVAAFFVGEGVVGGMADAAVAQSRAKVAAAAGNLGFTAIPSNIFDDVTLPEGYVGQAMLRWGDPINGRSPRFETDASNPAEHQERQFGQGHDGMIYFPLGRNRDSNTRGMMAVNHEYTLTELHFPDGSANWNAPKTRKEQAGHGVSVAEIVRKRDGSWNVVPSSRARRVTPNTRMRLTGPAAGHRLVKTRDDRAGNWVRGMVNQCGSARTPWNTYITTEENFNGYFWEESGGTAPGITEEQAGLNARYGVAGRGFGYNWASTDERWRADLNPNRPNAFGYMVEIDPYNANVAPQKRTALGRFKHEGAAFLTAPTGEVAVYMGDDQRFDYIYKFVSARPWKDEIAAGRSPLDEGTLYVARFDEDGSGEWLPLVQGTGPLTAENGFADQGDVVIKARLAADLLGATPMDRPEWTTSNEYTGEVFVTCTNNTRRGRVDDTAPDGTPLFEATPGRFVPSVADAANPRLFNAFGHILKWNEGGDPTATTFQWSVFLLGGDDASGTGETGEDAFGAPDGLWLDDYGILWIQTDGGQPDGSNNQMLACDPTTGEIKRFLVGPVDCEVTGITSTPDGTTVFINIQHPGDSAGASNPTETSTWPDGDPSGRPRAATVAIRRVDGGRVGT